jgi:hypothetical protein
MTTDNRTPTSEGAREVGKLVTEDRCGAVKTTIQVTEIFGSQPPNHDYTRRKAAQFEAIPVSKLLQVFEIPRSANEANSYVDFASSGLTPQELMGMFKRRFQLRFDAGFLIAVKAFHSFDLVLLQASAYRCVGNE